MKESYLVIF